MTKLLVVDDEPAITRGLMRAILHRRPDYAVLTASGGAEAVSLLEEQYIDLVITDLQMTDMDGFELLAWMVSQRPQVFALAMTGFRDDETDRRLRALGGIECFRKPVDIDALVSRITNGLARSIRGDVHNVGLASFLQLVELEKKTCTLEVRSADQVGKLYLRNGELIDARTGTLSGEAAACEIIDWPQVGISIDSGCPATVRTIQKPAHYLVMETMRVRDESMRAPPPDPEADTEDPLSWGPVFATSTPQESAATPPPSAKLEAFRVPMGALLLAVIDGSTGAMLLGPENHASETAALVQDAWFMLRQSRSMLANGGERIEEVALLTASRGELIRPIPRRDSYAFLIFDPQQTNLVMARLELESFMQEYASA